MDTQTEKVDDKLNQNNEKQIVLANPVQSKIKNIFHSLMFFGHKNRKTICCPCFLIYIAPDFVAFLICFICTVIKKNCVHASNCKQLWIAQQICGIVAIIIFIFRIGIAFHKNRKNDEKEKIIFGLALYNIKMSWSERNK
jgi:hypothetical protein